MLKAMSERNVCSKHRQNLVDQQDIKFRKYNSIETLPASTFVQQPLFHKGQFCLKGDHYIEVELYEKLQQIL